MQIAYEPHPVSAERKAELRAAGIKIVDLRFAPADHVVEVAEPAPAKRTRKPKVTE
jgi:hypothetical protein